MTNKFRFVYSEKGAVLLVDLRPALTHGHELWVVTKNEVINTSGPNILNVASVKQTDDDDDDDDF